MLIWMITSPKFTDCSKSSTTPWHSPIRHGSVMMMPSTPLAWRFDSAEFTLKNYDDFFECLFLNVLRGIHPSDEVVLASNNLLTMLQFLMYIGEAELKTSVKTCDKNSLLCLDT
ncbi:hypothetical protein Bca52824_002117 [Brassica carinata]|uniref:Uncharacterized protein n=1 Tax=Brassica carinata TaxID=52824 RepID=A0A8X8BDN9_BRACI|nr:hypothetical protein Bca52824_002117 [Brassica carinata]